MKENSPSYVIICAFFSEGIFLPQLKVKFKNKQKNPHVLQSGQASISVHDQPRGLLLAEEDSSFTLGDRTHPSFKFYQKLFAEMQDILKKVSA